LPVNKEAYEAFEKEAKKHFSKYRKNPLAYTDSIIVSKEGDIFYLLLGVARNSGDASTQEFDETYDMWSAHKNNKILSLNKNHEILIPFDGEFGYLKLANYPNSMPAHEEQPAATPVISSAPKEILPEETPAKKDTIYMDKPVFVPIILALDLNGFEMVEKNLYFNECHNYLLDFRGKNSEEMLQAYENWRMYLRLYEKAKKWAPRETIYKNSFEGY